MRLWIRTGVRLVDTPLRSKLFDGSRGKRRQGPQDRERQHVRRGQIIAIVLKNPHGLLLLRSDIC